MSSTDVSSSDSKGKGPFHLKSVGPDGAPRVLDKKHLADLQSSGLNDESVHLSGCYSAMKNTEVSKILGWSWRNGAALVIPFYDYNTGELLLSRVKPDRPRNRMQDGKGKLTKYEQPKGVGSQPYIASRCIKERLLDEAKRIVICEGEKKAMLLDQLGFACIGLTGVHNFSDATKRAEGDGLCWSKGMAKLQSKFVGKAVTIAFDADVWSNSQVMLAARRLAGLLQQSGAREIKLLKIPKPGKSGVDDYFVQEGDIALQSAFSEAVLCQEGGAFSLISPSDPLLHLKSLPWLKGSGIQSDLRLPPKYEIRRDKSLWFRKSEDSEPAEVMSHVLLPTGILSAEDAHEERVQVAYLAEGKWGHDHVHSKAIRDSKRALAELPPGVSIDSHNAGDVVRWMSDYMRHNRARMSRQHFVQECGWKNFDEQECFVLAEAIGTDAHVLLDDSGDRAHLHRALRARGKLELHQIAIKEAFDADPLCAIAILTSLGAPLLKPLGAPNFIVNLFGDSSRGKTSMLKMAASVYGDPENGQWVSQWNLTEVAMELRAQMLCDLPLFVDEVGAGGDPYMMQRLMYALSAGMGRMRANRQLHVRRTATFRNLMLSSGESEIVDERAAAGAQVRALQFEVAGFGSLDGPQVDALRGRCAEHAGQVGRTWIELLVAQSAAGGWLEIQQELEVLRKQFRAEAQAGSLAGRQAGFYAFLAITEHLASKLLGIGHSHGQTVLELFRDGSHQRQIETVQERVLGILRDWVVAEGQSFPTKSFGSNGEAKVALPPGGRKLLGVRGGGQVGFVPSELFGKLHDHKLNPAVVMRVLDRAGHLDTGGGQKRSRTVRLGSERVRMFMVWSSALGFEEAEPDVQDDFVQ